MNQKTLAMIGIGNVGGGIINGLTNYSNIYSPHNILRVKRNYFHSPQDEFLYPKKIAECSSVILAVKPVDAIPALNLLRGKIAEGTVFISTVTGLGTDIISKMLEIPHQYIAKLTLDINVGYSNGTVVYRAGERALEAVDEIFSPLALQLIPQRSKKIIDATVYAGSGAAFVAKWILLDAKENAGSDFQEYLQNLNMRDTGVENFITVMESACDRIFHKHSYNSTMFESTLRTLQASCTSPADIHNYIEMVATPGGCTRDGIDKFDSLEKITHQSFTEAFYAVKAKANSLKSQIRLDFSNWKQQQMKMRNVIVLPKLHQ